jgi:ribosomal-protein-alanine N-acetyltransferase
MVSRKIGEINIRFAVPKDISEIISINLKTLPEHYSHSFFIELLIDSPETFLVAELNNKIIGYIMCRTEHGFSAVKKMRFAIVSFAVLDDYRRKGIGKCLLEEAIRGMQSRKCSEAYLEVRTNNDAAIELYKNLGFDSSITLNNYYKDGENAFLMSKRIQEKNTN